MYSTARSPPVAAVLRLHVGLGLLVLCALIVLVGAKVLELWRGFEHAQGVATREAATLYVARRVQEEGSLFGNWREVPHVVTWHGPVLYLAAGYIGRCTDATSEDLLAIGRSISLIASLGTVGLLVWLLRAHWAVSLPIALAAGMAYLAIGGGLSGLDYAFCPDAPGCFLSLLGAAFVLRSERPAFLYVSVFVFLLAFFCKQLSLAGPPAVALWLWVEGRHRCAICYAAVSAAVFVAAVGVVNSCTDGRYWLNNVEALKGNLNLYWAPYFLRQAIKVARLPLALGLLAAALDWLQGPRRFPAVFFLLSLAVTTVGVRSDGLWVGYHMPALAMACLLGGRQLGDWWKERLSLPVANVALTLALVLGTISYVPEAVLTVARLPVSWRRFEKRQQDRQAQTESMRIASEYLERLSGPVLCEDNTIALRCPPSIMIDAFAFGNMARAGVFDDRRLIQDIRQGRLAAIVLTARGPGRSQAQIGLSLRWRRAMKDRYRQVRLPGVKGVEIHRPVGYLGQLGRRGHER